MKIEKLMSVQKKNINDIIGETFESIVDLSKNTEKIKNIKNRSALVQLKGRKVFIPYKDIKMIGNDLVIKNRKKGKLLFI